MFHPQPYNPLDLRALAQNIELALLLREPTALPPPEPFNGAGIYAIYYHGPFRLYKPISSKDCKVPIYVGRALPAGARQGKVGIGEPPGRVLFNRLREHGRSIEAVRNLELNDFRTRFLVVEDLFVSLGERLTIQRFQPLWNQVIDGFGNHDPGAGRRAGARSEWDVLHPGRSWADLLVPGRDAAAIRREVKAHLRDVASQPPPEASAGAAAS